MRPFRTTPSIPIIFGNGAANETGGELKKLGAKKLLVVYDAGVYKAGIVEPILESIRKAGIAYVTFDKVLPDPPDYCVEEGSELAKKEKIDSVLGIGGGSAIDVAKVISVYRHMEPPLHQYLAGGEKADISYKTYREGPLVFIPTTAGTGAEMSAGGVISDTIAKTKKSFDGWACRADLAILDPTLTLSVPPYITATTGMDALCHSIETMTGLKRSDRTDMINGHAVELIWRSLPKAFASGNNLEARSELLIGANLAFTSDAGTNFGHAIAHAMGEVHLVHGHICARIIPPYVRYMGRAGTVDPEMRLVARAMGLNLAASDVAEEIAKAVEDRNQEMGLKSIKDMGIDRSVFMSSIESIYTTHIERVKRGNPPPGRQQCLEILAQIYE